MVLNRLVAPKSEHAMPNWIRATAIGDLLDVDFAELTDSPLYRNLDRLHPNRVAIEKALVARERSLFNLDPTIFFYDLTSTYFEGQALANPKARRGYSRDQRPDCKQVVVGLAVGKEGFPLAHEVYAGNTQDRQTLPLMLDSLEKRVGATKGMTVVVDRGMAYAENLAEIRRRELHYVVAARQPERDQWREEFEKAEGFEEVHREPSPRNPFQQKSTVRVKRIAEETEQWILCSSSERVAKDRATARSKNRDFWRTWQSCRRGLPTGVSCGRWPSARPSVGSRNVILGWHVIMPCSSTPVRGNWCMSLTRRRRPRRSFSTGRTYCERIERTSPPTRLGGSTSP